MNTSMEPAGLPDVNQADPNWSEMRETVRMLELATAQILMAMRDGDESVSTVATSFTSLADTVNSIARAASEWHGAADTQAIRSEVISRAAEAQAGVQATIVAFQFYDKLTQRLDHVTKMLSDVSDLVSAPQRACDLGEWRKMQDAIRSRYSMQEEQEMFDALVSGKTVEQALELVREKLSHGEIDAIELF